MINWRGRLKNLAKGFYQLTRIGASDDVIRSPDCFISLSSSISGEGLGLSSQITDSLGLTAPINGDPIGLQTFICDC